MTTIACLCGYAGPAVAEGSRSVCPICRSPAGDGSGGKPEPSAFAAAAGSVDSPPDPAGMPFGDGAEDASEADALAMRKTLRIPCPNGHVNITPAHMLGTQVVCPKCNAFYVLQIGDSLEYRRVAEAEAKKKDEEEARKWLDRAIYAAIFVGISLAGMIVLSLVYR